jgi:hypothetical protein
MGSNKGNVVSHVVRSGVSSPPAQGAPAAPAGFTPLDRTTVQRLNKMTAAQLASTQAVASELMGSKTYEDDFGKDSPDVNGVVAVLGVASAWATEAARAKRWSEYAGTQRELAADAAMLLMNGLGVEVQHALAKHPELADAYPQLVAFVGARSAAGKKGAATRKAKKKAAAPAK